MSAVPGKSYVKSCVFKTAGDTPAPRPHFGGAVSRFVAYVVDLGVSIGVFMLGLAAISFAASIITGPAPDAEVKVRGTARLEVSPQVHQRYAAAVRANLGWQPVPGQFTLFAIDIDDVTYIGSDPGTGAQHVARWPPGTEYLRPQTTPTSLAPPQEVKRLLA